VCCCNIWEQEASKKGFSLCFILFVFLCVYQNSEREKECLCVGGTSLLVFILSDANPYSPLVFGLKSSFLIYIFEDSAECKNYFKVDGWWWCESFKGRSALSILL
jgi:hypothetical protein